MWIGTKSNITLHHFDWNSKRKRNKKKSTVKRPLSFRTIKPRFRLIWWKIIFGLTFIHDESFRSFQSTLIGMHLGAPHKLDHMWAVLISMWRRALWRTFSNHQLSTSPYGLDTAKAQVKSFWWKLDGSVFIVLAWRPNIFFYWIQTQMSDSMVACRCEMVRFILIHCGLGPGGPYPAKKFYKRAAWGLYIRGSKSRPKHHEA